MRLVGVVLCQSLCLNSCVGIVVVVVVAAFLTDGGPFAESIFAADQACAVIGEM